MPVEIEAKMAVEDFAPVREALRQLGAEGVGRVLEINAFFDTPGGDLLKAGSGLRLRTNRDTDTGAETYVITHKGPLQHGQAKTREETELTVSDAADAERLLTQLGFRKELSFEKRRETWKLGGCKVELDELPRLGRYVEVEGPDEPTVMKVRERLGLSGRPLIKTGYVGLLTRHLKERGESPREVTFADAPA